MRNLLECLLLTALMVAIGLVVAAGMQWSESSNIVKKSVVNEASQQTK